MDETTLLFRHLPAELSKEERKDLLFSFGASRVNVMGTSGRLKNTAFAAFPSKDHATEVLHQLHQADLLGSKLVVEIARQNDSRTPSILDGETKKLNAVDGGQTRGKQGDLEQTKQEPKEIKFDATFCAWGLKHPRRPELRYRYPPPTPSILTNIMNALVAIPKFYVQVLHLMNKMDLPAPFGTVTPAPPLAPSHVMPDDVNQKEMDISASEDETESEMESDGESKRENRSQDANASVDKASRQRRKNLKKLVRTKRPRLSEFQQADNSMSETIATNVPIQDVFEQMPGSSTGTTAPVAKKMALNLKLSSLESSERKSLSSSSDWSNISQHRIQQQHPNHSALPPAPVPPLSQVSSLNASALNNSDRNTTHHPPSYPPLPPRPPSHHHHHNNPPPPPPPPSNQYTHLPDPQHPPPSLPAQDIHQQDPSRHNKHQPHPDPDHQEPNSGSHLYSPSTHDDNRNPEEASIVDKSQETISDGFGTIPQVAKTSESTKQEKTSSSKESIIGQDRKFISSSSLRRGRLTKEELQELSVFRRYDPGEASCRLYIKNVARQATEEDLHHIYGRYVDWDSETEVNMFDVRLMKEGRMKGQAFVTMPSQEVATDALSDTNGFVLKDKPLVVQFARSAKAQEDAAAVKS